MNNRKQKIAWLKKVFSKKANPAPVQCDLIAFYPGLKKKYYLFIDGREVDINEYQAAIEKNKSLGTPAGGQQLYFGPESGAKVPDPLPDYFDIKAETL